jgi:hypothetical protein
MASSATWLRQSFGTFNGCLTTVPTVGVMVAGRFDERPLPWQIGWSAINHHVAV